MNISHQSPRFLGLKHGDTKQSNYDGKEYSYMGLMTRQDEHFLFFMYLDAEQRIHEIEIDTTQEYHKCFG